MGNQVMTGKCLCPLVARKRALKPELLNLTRRVEGTVNLLPRTVGERISVSTDLADDLWMTLADRGEIDCAVLNLVANARDAMPKGGAIQIATSNVALDAPRPCVANSLSVSMRGK
jgi:signal transduction histidine kinase